MLSTYYVSGTVLGILHIFVNLDNNPNEQCVIITIL